MAEKLHYSMAEVEKDYTETYGMFMKAAAVGIVGAILYFFALAVFLGGWGHTPTKDFVRDFVADGRIEPEYAGTKLPMYENPALAVPAEPVVAPVAEAAPVAAEPTTTPAAH